MTQVSRGISFHESLFYSIHQLVDAAVIMITVHFALRHTDTATLHDVLTISAATVLVYHVVAELSGVYRSWRGSRLRREIACILLTWAYAVPVLLGVGLLTQYNAQFSYTSKLVWIFTTPAVIAAARMVLRKVLQRLRARGFNTRRYAICGVNELGIQVARNIESSPEMGLRLAGFFDDRPTDRTVDLPGEFGSRVGDVERLIQGARRGTIDIVYITFPMRAEERIRDVLSKLADTTASVYIVPDFFVFELLHARWTNINGLPAVSVFENPLYGADGLLKRTADLLIGSVLLAAAAIPMLVISRLIKRSSPGPVFFRQRRYGLDGREILVWKFRTMTCCDNGDVVRQATRDDRASDSDRPLSAPHIARRATAVVQRAGGQHVARRPAAACQRSQRAIPQHDRRLHAAAQGQARHHRPGPSKRLPRRNGNARENGTASRLRSPVHPRMVVLDGREDPGEDAERRAEAGECVLRKVLVVDTNDQRLTPNDYSLRLEDLRIVIRVEVPRREAVVDLQIRVRKALFQRRPAAGLVGPEVGVVMDRDAELVVEE